MNMTIGGLAKAGEVGVETVRYYQRRGLLPLPERPAGGGSAGGARRYGAGFTLEQIAGLLRLDATEERGAARALARQCLDDLDRRIAELEAARGWLSRLEADCAEGGAGPCPILAAFER